MVPTLLWTPPRARTPEAVVRSFFERLPAGLLLNLGAGSTRFDDGDRRAVGVDIDRFFRPDGIGAAADAAALPFRDESFDGALLKDVIEHVADPIGVASEVARVCRPGARILVTTPRAIARAVWADPTHIRGFTASALVTVLDKAGWEPLGEPRRIGGLPGAGRLGLEAHLERLMAIPGLGHWYGTNWIVEAKLRRR
jgi:SAM-dependent methyltransferase